MPSIIIAAHNEARVIGRCLDELTRGGDDLQITVAANGCSDGTADVARGYRGVQVVELPTAGKAAALNAAEVTSTRYPRVYLDADVVISADGIRDLCAALDGTVQAVVPRRVLVLTGRPMLVRAYYAISARLPAFQHGLFGRGVIAVSEAGRGRFAQFPDLLADDLFLDSLFAGAEKRQVATVTSTVATPRRTADLFRRLVRVRSGNAAMRRVGDEVGTPQGVRPRDGTAWLSTIAARPWLAPAGVVYAALTAAAAWRARHGDVAWGQDRSTRTGAPECTT